MKPTGNRPAANVLGVHIDAVDMEQALAHITEALHDQRKGYICVAGAHGLVEAQRSRELFHVYACSEMTLPDGMPLVWAGHHQGYETMERVTGPDLMREIFRRQEFASATHYFYGGRPGVAEELKNKLTAQFPWIRVVGTYTPPFRELCEEEEEQFIAEVNHLKPDMIWVGISCPRQEVFMARHISVLQTRLMFGVGAAFDYHTGRIRDCSDWIKRAGLQWLHRLLQDPRHLWKRYLRTHPAFLWYTVRQFFGLNRFPVFERGNEPHPQGSATRAGNCPSEP